MSVRESSFSESTPEQVLREGCYLQIAVRLNSTQPQQFSWVF
jgi:hypothetical protein